MNEQQPSHAEILAATDPQLIDWARQGSSKALEVLLARQQLWVFNLAFYMLHRREDAEDATQEILVKVATRLGSFQGRSAFRTWVRRIAINHLLDAKPSRPEKVVTGFDCYSEYLENAQSSDFVGERGATPETLLLVEEARISCTLGMLLCLDRQQRLAFLLGEVLGVDDSASAELLDISKDNFRQRLHRAREQLSNFMMGHCGLVNTENTCRCVKKTSAFVRDGIVDEARLQFSRDHLELVSSMASELSSTLKRVLVTVRDEQKPLYPLYAPPNVARGISAILNDSELSRALHLSQGIHS